jgi:hypothetical protein
MWANRQHRARRLPENLFGNRTEYHLSKSRAPAGPKHDQVDFLLSDQIGHHLAVTAITSERDSSHIVVGAHLLGLNC